MVKYGMTPSQAIDSATRSAAALLDLQDQIASIEPGKVADLIAVAGNPLADISLLGNVSFVMKEGIVYKSPGRDSEL